MPPMSHLASRHGLGRAALTGAGLGLVFGVHVAILASATPAAWLQPWCIFAAALCAFHMLEFLWAAIFEPATVSCDAFLLNHSPQYHAALGAAALEFWLEAWLVPSWKGWGLFPYVGLALVLGGQVLRSAAMWKAGSHFTHLVAEDRREGHDLVTTGVYSSLRHPSYTGWFWWSVGMQLLLANPLCTVAWAYASWRFFAERIPREEGHLVEFFGDSYVSYAKHTRILIPGIPSTLGGAGSGLGALQLPPQAQVAVAAGLQTLQQAAQRVRSRVAQMQGASQGHSAGALAGVDPASRER